MHKEKVNGFELEYASNGTGEPLLLISTGPLADSFQPFLRERALSERYCMIAYHQRGQAGSAPATGPGPVSFEQHAADAAALLRHLDVPRAHVAGHSTGALIALQLAVDDPGLVHTLTLLEPPLTVAPSATAFFEKAAPAVAAYRAGDLAGAMEKFLTVVSGLDWPACRRVIDKHVPGGVAQAIEDAPNFFAGYLAALTQWQFGAAQAATIQQPVLSVLGTATEPWFVDSHALLQAWFPRLEERRIDGLGHLLHMQDPEPVAKNVGAWLGAQPMLRA